MAEKIASACAATSSPPMTFNYKPSGAMPGNEQHVPGENATASQ